MDRKEKMAQVVNSMLVHLVNDLNEDKVDLDTDRVIIMRKSGLKGKENEDYHTFTFMVVSSKEEIDLWTKVIDTVKTQDWDSIDMKLDDMRAKKLR